MAAEPSTFLNRRLVTDKPYRLRSLPANWPLQSGPRLRLNPPVWIYPDKRYRLKLDLDAGTAMVSEEAS
ncbi:MAG TPA: hypothetical protein VNF91_05885 [Candidatus Acidoferrum sp.]|nr:hypothetical protein [Candidatus Acidoferrum sp.]